MERDYDRYNEEDVSKFNRHKQQEPKKNETLVDWRQPTRIHFETRKQREKRSKEFIKKTIKRLRK